MLGSVKHLLVFASMALPVGRVRRHLKRKKREAFSRATGVDFTTAVSVRNVGPKERHAPRRARMGKGRNRRKFEKAEAVAQAFEGLRKRGHLFKSKKTI